MNVDDALHSTAQKAGHQAPPPPSAEEIASKKAGLYEACREVYEGSPVLVDANDLADVLNDHDRLVGAPETPPADSSHLTGTEQMDAYVGRGDIPKAVKGCHAARNDSTIDSSMLDQAQQAFADALHHGLGNRETLEATLRAVLPAKVYLAYGFQGENFTVHTTRDGALAKVRALAEQQGVPDLDLIDGEYDELDGYTVEEQELLS